MSETGTALPARSCGHPEWCGPGAKPPANPVHYHCACGANWSCPTCGWGAGAMPCRCDRERQSREFLRLQKIEEAAKQFRRVVYTDFSSAARKVLDDALAEPSLGGDGNEEPASIQTRATPISSSEGFAGETEE